MLTYWKEKNKKMDWLVQIMDVMNFCLCTFHELLLQCLLKLYYFRNTYLPAEAQRELLGTRLESGRLRCSVSSLNPVNLCSHEHCRSKKALYCLVEPSQLSLSKATICSRWFGHRKEIVAVLGQRGRVSIMIWPK